MGTELVALARVDPDRIRAVLRLVYCKHSGHLSTIAEVLGVSVNGLVQLVSELGMTAELADVRARRRNRFRLPTLDGSPIVPSWLARHRAKGEAYSRSYLAREAVSSKKDMKKDRK